METYEMIEQIEATILLIKRDGKDWLDERDIPWLEKCAQVLKKEIEDDTRI